MNSVRLRRLSADYEALRRLVRLHPRLEIEGVSGDPPERYRLVLKVRSLRQQGERLEYAEKHRLEVILPQGYPRDAPVCRMLTPVFHPNIAPHAVCVGDHWTAAEALDVMIQRIGEMLAYQSYNIKSPLNGQAARWAESNPTLLPTDPKEFFIDLATVPAEVVVPKTACSNCSSLTTDGVHCTAKHLLCKDCVIHCDHCQTLLCLSCGSPRCKCPESQKTPV